MILSLIINKRHSIALRKVMPIERFSFLAVLFKNYRRADSKQLVNVSNFRVCKFIDCIVFSVNWYPY